MEDLILRESWLVGSLSDFFPLYLLTCTWHFRFFPWVIGWFRFLCLLDKHNFFFLIYFWRYVVLILFIAIELLTSQQMFSRKKPGSKKTPQIFPNFYSIGRSLFVSTFSGFGKFFQSFENLSRKSILSNKTISYLHDLQQICTSSPKALKISSNHGVVWVLFIMTTPWFDKNVICIAFQWWWSYIATYMRMFLSYFMSRKSNWLKDSWKDVGRGSFVSYAQIRVPTYSNYLYQFRNYCVLHTYPRFLTASFPKQSWKSTSLFRPN